MTKKFLKFWLPCILWAIVIFSFSSHPTTSTSQIYWHDFIVKKSAHMIEYAIFAGLLFRAFLSMGFKRREAAIYAIIIACTYGMSDEFHQSFTPGREPRARDVFFDTIGASISALTLWKLLPKAPKKLLNLAKKLDYL